MSLESPNQVVTLDYNLLHEDYDYVDDIERAFGSGDECLGVLLVKNVPGLQSKRTCLLELASHLGNLPEAELAKAKDPDTEWIGWDRGSESFDGKPDLAKGSFYANPLYDNPACANEPLRAQFPELLKPNRWLPDSLPQLEPAFKDLAQLIVQTAGLVARQCDKYAKARNITNYPGDDYLRQVVTTSRACKARLLHYYPLNSLPDYDASSTKADGSVQDNLCGWHLDNSAITGLTSALYVREHHVNGKLQLEHVDPPSDAGLFIRTRSGKVLRIGIPKDCVAFQIGEALERSTSGQLRATSHCVFGGSQTDLARNTLAVFCQPDLTAAVTKDMTFAEFCKQVYAKNHASVQVDQVKAAKSA